MESDRESNDELEDASNGAWDIQTTDEFHESGKVQWQDPESNPTNQKS